MNEQTMPNEPSKALASLTPEQEQLVAELAMEFITRQMRKEHPQESDYLWKLPNKEARQAFTYATEFAPLLARATEVDTTVEFAHAMTETAEIIHSSPVAQVPVAEN